MRGQQRQGRNSRQLNTQRPPFREGLAVGAVAVNGAELILSIVAVSQPPTGGVVPGQLHIYGQPQVLRQVDASYPETWAFNTSTSQLHLYYGGGDFAEAEQLYIGPQDESMRAGDGGYLGSTIITLPYLG